MKHLGFDTLSRVSGPCGAFLFCCLLAFCLALVPASADEGSEHSIEFLSLDPEPVTGESLGFATAVLRNPSDGSLWIGMADKGLLRIGRNGRRIRYTKQNGHLPSDHIKGICSDSEGIQYILDAEGAVTRYSSVEGFRPVTGLPGPVVSLSSSGDQVYLLLDSGAIYQLSTTRAPSLYAESGKAASFLAVAPGGCLYVADSHGSVMCFSDGKGVALPSTSEELNCLFPSSDGSLWAGTDRGFYHFSDARWDFYDMREVLPSSRIVSVCEDAQKRLWVATGRGLCCLDVSKPNVSKSEIIFPDEAFMSLASSVDSSQIYYVGGVRGVAAVTLDGPFDLAPWVAPDPEGPGPSSRSIPFWFWIISALLLAVGFVLGTRFKKPSPVVAPPVQDGPTEPEVVVLPPDSTDHQPVPERPVVPRQAPANVNPSSSVSSLSPDELFQLLDKLDNSHDVSFVSTVYDKIKDSYADSKLSVEDIAQHVSMTRVHVNRKLQASLGVSPSLLLKAYRMRLAASLLVANEIPVSEIASRTGFSSSSYFSSAFKEFFGRSPSEYVSSK